MLRTTQKDFIEQHINGTQLENWSEIFLRKANVITVEGLDKMVAVAKAPLGRVRCNFSPGRRPLHNMIEEDTEEEEQQQEQEEQEEQEEDAKEEEHFKYKAMHRPLFEPNTIT